MSLHKNPQAKGAFIGINSSHTAGDLGKAIVEGVAYYLKNAMDVFRQAGNDPEGLTLIGGALKSSLWRKVLCDVIGLPCAIPKDSEQAISIAAAITGGVGIGMFDGFDVCNEFISLEETLAPDFKKHRMYEKLNALGEKAYCALENINAEISDVLRSGI